MNAVESLQKALQEHHQSGQSVLIRGGGTRLPEWDGPVLDTAGLNQWRFFQPEDMVLGVEAGVPMRDVIKRVNDAGMHLPVVPLFKDATVGGVVAANDWGGMRMMNGGIRDLIIGMEYLKPDGTLVKSGGRVVKNVTGYDLAKMMTGSVGGFGLMTSINLKMSPKPQDPHSLFFRMRNSMWIDWFREEIHKARLPVDWAQAFWNDGSWVLGMGISGNAARRHRLLNDLQQAFDNQLLCLPEGEEPDWAQLMGPSSRREGYLDAHVAHFGADYIHLHLRISTRAFLTRQRLVEQLTGLPECRLIVHPLGADIHLIGPPHVLNEETLDRLRRGMAGCDAYMVLERAPQSLLQIFGLVVPLSGAYALMQGLKKHLDPTGIFHAPFYAMV